MKRKMSPEAYRHSLEYTKRYREQHPDKTRAWYEKYYASNREKILARNKLWRDSQKPGVLRKIKNSYRRRHPEYDKNRQLMQRYKIRLDDLLRMQAAQENKCALCERERPLQVDHCHKSGRVRGLLCAACNLKLGVFEETILKLGLEKVFAYIRKK